MITKLGKLFMEILKKFKNKCTLCKSYIKDEIQNKIVECIWIDNIKTTAKPMIQGKYIS